MHTGIPIVRRTAFVALTATAFLSLPPSAHAVVKLANGGLIDSWDGDPNPDDPANGWYWVGPGWNQNTTTTSFATGPGGPASVGNGSLKVTVPKTNFNWNVIWKSFDRRGAQPGIEPMIRAAGADNISDYFLTYDVIYKTAEIPASPASVEFPWINGALIVQFSSAATRNAGTYVSKQFNSVALANPRVDSTQTVMVPLADITDGTYSIGSDFEWIQIVLATNGSYAGTPLTVYYDNMRIVARGDANRDGAIDQADLDALVNGFNNNLTGYANGDFNGDGKVSADDFAKFNLSLAQYNASPAPAGPVPEPAGVATILSAATAARLLRRRRTA